jgi:hypothetical protein
MTSDPTPANDTGLAKIWQTRFDFFRRFGLPRSSQESREAYRVLSLDQRMNISANVLAFVFGPVYFLAKGMWRKGLVLILVEFAVIFLFGMLGFSEIWLRAIGVGFAILATLIANYSFFLHKTRASTSWNPLEGFGRRAMS